MIRIEAAGYSDIAEAVEGAMMKAGLPIYRRGNRLVSPVVREVEGANGMPTAAAQFADIGPEWLRQFMERAATFERFNSRAKQWLPVQPPEDIAHLVLARIADWPFREVAGVITAPTLGPRGQLVDAVGFDASTRLYLAELPIMPMIDERPDKAAALRALDDLKALLSEFRFTDTASLAVALSGLITPVCRGAIPLAPMHAASAPDAGSGKSMLWDIASVIATGRICPALAAARNVDEMEKRLGAIMLKGQALVSLDNINGALRSDLLCQILERPRVEVRILGSSRSPDIECRTTWFATGNNLDIIGDLNRRTITAHLDANVERPELRKFKTDPIAVVMRERGRYVAACLTIVRAYIAAGLPGKKTRLASYGPWSDLVRSALIWLGCADPVATIENMRENDPSLEHRRIVFAAWPADGVDYTAAGLIRLSDPNDDGAFVQTPAGEQLREALLMIAPAPKGNVDPIALGKWLSANRNRKVARRKLVRNGHNRANKTLWKIEADEGVEPEEE
ncbi:MAG TPA: hypothetical protein VGX71_05365 [Pseudaminobacter sp.]|nr:hypothetical protein [Pseudaminobacter sp.]